MANFTTSITIKGDELGNDAGWYIFVGPVSGNFWGFSGVTITEWCDQMVSDFATLGYGTLQYSIDGPTNFNTGTDTIINFTYTSSEIVYFFVIQTDDNYYPAGFNCTPVVCEGAYELTLTACEGNYVIPAGLTPTSNYYFSIETNRNKRYVQAVSTNVDGDVQLWANAPEFPTGFFTPEMMTMTGKVYSDIDLTNQVNFTIDNIVYSTINLNFVYTIIVSD